MLSSAPTREAFKQHVYRSHCQAAIWMSAMFPDLPDLDPANYGWTYGETNIPLPVKLPDDVTPTPVEVLHIIRYSCSSERPYATGRYSCVSAQMFNFFCICNVSMAAVIHTQNR